MKANEIGNIVVKRFTTKVEDVNYVIDLESVENGVGLIRVKSNIGMWEHFFGAINKKDNLSPMDNFLDFLKAQNSDYILGKINNCSLNFGKTLSTTKRRVIREAINDFLTLIKS